jgi:hypothetical protein
MKNNSSMIWSANVIGHVNGESEGSEGGWNEVRIHKIDAFGKGEGGIDEERAVEEIRSRIRGWSVNEKKEIRMGVVSEVRVDGGATVKRSSVGSEEGILGGFGRVSEEEVDEGDEWD